MHMAKEPFSPTWLEYKVFQSCLLSLPTIRDERIINLICLLLQYRLFHKLPMKMTNKLHILVQNQSSWLLNIHMYFSELLTLIFILGCLFSQVSLSYFLLI